MWQATASSRYSGCTDNYGRTGRCDYTGEHLIVTDSLVIVGSATIGGADGILTCFSRAGGFRWEQYLGDYFRGRRASILNIEMLDNGVLRVAASRDTSGNNTHTGDLLRADYDLDGNLLQEQQQMLSGVFLSFGARALRFPGSDDYAVAQLSEIGDTSRAGDVYVGRFDKAGRARWETWIDDKTSGSFVPRALLPLGDESMAVLYTSVYPDYGQPGTTGIARINRDGVVERQWTLPIDSTRAFRPWRTGTAMCTLPDGGFIVANDVFGYENSGPYLYPSIIKLDSTGAVVWERALKGYSYASIRTVARFPDGSILCGGYTSRFQSSQGRAREDSATDILLARIDADGSVRWQQSYGNEGTLESIQKVVILSDSEFVASGQSNDRDLYLALLHDTTKAHLGITSVATDGVFCTLAPNPASGRTWLTLRQRLSGKHQEGNIRLYSATGEAVKTLWTGMLEAEVRIPLELDGVEPGRYLLECRAGSAATVTPLVVVR